MPNLSKEELNALAYYAIGVSTEGGDSAYQLSFCGDTRSPGVLEPIGNSGYTIGEMQTDMGWRHDVADALVNSFNKWAKDNHPDWMIKDQTLFAADLARDGNHIRDANYDADNANYKHEHRAKSIPSSNLPRSGRDIDETFKEHINTYLRTDAGKSFIHRNDEIQIKELMDNVRDRLEHSNLYKHSSLEDQAKIFAVVAKAYNQSPNWANQIMDGVKTGGIKNLDDISKKIDAFPDGKSHYMRSGRDAALKGAELFNDLRKADERNALYEPWQAIMANPLVDPSKVDKDPHQPHLAHQYATIKGAFVQPEQGRAMVHALTLGLSYNYGDPTNEHSRGFYAEGKDFLQWDRDGHGRAFVDGQWSTFTRDELSLKRNKDQTLDVHLTRDGVTQSLLHVAHPADYAQVTSHHPVAHQHRDVLHQGMRGDDVQHLQDELAQLGYTDAKGRALHPDKNYGAATRHAIGDFQRDFGLKPDGQANAVTQETLEAAVKQSQRVTAELSQPLPTLADPGHPQHSLYERLKAELPVGISQERLMQATAACHMAGINAPKDLYEAHICADSVFFIPASLNAMHTSMDLLQPAPTVQQTMQQMQTYDQQEAQFMAKIYEQQQQQQQQQLNQHGPVLGGPPMQHR